MMRWQATCVFLRLRLAVGRLDSVTKMCGVMPKQLSVVLGLWSISVVIAKCDSLSLSALLIPVFSVLVLVCATYVALGVGTLLVTCLVFDLGLISANALCSGQFGFSVWTLESPNLVLVCVTDWKPSILSVWSFGVRVCRCGVLLTGLLVCSIVLLLSRWPVLSVSVCLV